MTKAIYKIDSNYFYNPYNGTPDGANHYFINMIINKEKNSNLSSEIHFKHANENMQPIDDKDVLGFDDTAYNYFYNSQTNNLLVKKINVEFDKDDPLYLEQIYNGSLDEFIFQHIHWDVTPKWSEFDALEIAACAESDGDVQRLMETNYKDEVDFYTIYGHFKTGGCEAILDLKSEQQCRYLANALMNRFEQLETLINEIPDTTINVNKYYRTRDGRPVRLHKIDAQDKSTFNVKGSIYKKNKGYHNNPEYQIWREKDGSAVAVGKSDMDLIEISQRQYDKLIFKKVDRQYDEEMSL